MKHITYNIASQIEGYDLENFFSFRSAHDTYYYDLSSKEEKIDYILELAESLFREISIRTATRIYNYLEKDYEDSNEHYYALKSLKYRK